VPSSLIRRLLCNDCLVAHSSGSRQSLRFSMSLIDIVHPHSSWQHGHIKLLNVEDGLDVSARSDVTILDDSICRYRLRAIRFVSHSTLTLSQATHTHSGLLVLKSSHFHGHWWLFVLMRQEVTTDQSAVLHTRLHLFTNLDHILFNNVFWH